MKIHCVTTTSPAMKTPFFLYFCNECFDATAHQSPNKAIREVPLEDIAIWGECSACGVNFKKGKVRQ